ncbi:MAG: anhydro-N-acetylmuramic acid kinase [Flavobacteriaceae bacterium]|nr:anhydro-N-acetylmuramic acid kinase [Flavobacteriaceae bacterium]
MNQEKYNIIGVMSGTSLDGIDLAHLNFEIINGKWKFQILESQTIRYSQEWINQLKIAVGFSESELDQLNKEYTLLLGNTISKFISKYKLEFIDAVCSHGHTILHQPKNGFTLQIGNLPEIATICNQKVVCDFRVQDVELGGQGAPLVPIGDRLLFPKVDYCLNLGGFSNVSFEENGNRIAFDISPVNTVLNFYANKLGLEYDDKGTISSTGNINSELLNELNELNFYKLAHPKSLGFEFVKEIVLPLIEIFEISIEDKLATFTEHIAYQIGLLLPYKKIKLLITGGGAYNDYLISRIEYFLKETSLLIPENKIIEFKEALIFGFLGVLKLRNEINTLSSVTGASKDHSSGKIYDTKK